MSEVPPVYRSRLDPNRTSLAQRAGASVASEQAVERALDWLARHQDADGRWDGGTSRFKDGSVFENDDSFTLHCPAGEVCFGECYYWEADTALTGLSLLAYLGAGYTHVDGKYARTVGKGLEFLRQSQKADGDLRGPSLAVGMYCHSMATLALCEAYALTGDARLRAPVERAVDFLVRSRAKDGLAWRYSPGAPTGDTSILGWAVMALKSAKTVGIPIPPPTQAGILEWLKKVSTGRDGGLALYQPNEKGTPTMTAEAWACRQFLEVGGPGPASDEAAAFLIRNPSDRGELNIYYLYYGTLAMYQHGGDAWSTWNARVRDEVVRRQRVKGHMAGSWDPDDSPYGTKGGRIYGTALATLTLEVYYRFLRLYEPSTVAPVAPKPTDGGHAPGRASSPAPAGALGDPDSRPRNRQRLVPKSFGVYNRRRRPDWRLARRARELARDEVLRPSAGGGALDVSTVLPLIWAQAPTAGSTPDPGHGHRCQLDAAAGLAGAPAVVREPDAFEARRDVRADLGRPLGVAARPGGPPGGRPGAPGAGAGDRATARRAGPRPAALGGARPVPAVGAAAGAGRRRLGARLDRQPDLLVQRRDRPGRRDPPDQGAAALRRGPEPGLPRGDDPAARRGRPGPDDPAAGRGGDCAVPVLDRPLGLGNPAADVDPPPVVAMGDDRVGEHRALCPLPVREPGDRQLRAAAGRLHGPGGGGGADADGPGRRRARGLGAGRAAQRRPGRHRGGGARRPRRLPPDPGGGRGVPAGVPGEVRRGRGLADCSRISRRATPRIPGWPRTSAGNWAGAWSTSRAPRSRSPACSGRWPGAGGRRAKP